MQKFNPEGTRYRISGEVTLKRINHLVDPITEPDVEIESDPVTEFIDHLAQNRIQNGKVEQDFDSPDEIEVVRYRVKLSDAELIEANRSTLQNGVLRKSSVKPLASRFVEVTGQAARDIIAICKKNEDKITLVKIGVAYHSA